MPAKTRILVVDDEPQTIRYLSMNLKARGYEVLVAADGCEALKLSEEHHLDLVLLDLGIPGPDGFQVLKALRRWTDVPVLVVTARGQERDKVRALDLGADDYLTKPFGAQELLARVRAHLRRAACQGAGPRDPFELGDLHIDFAKRQVRVHGQFVHLTPTEYAVMEQLALAGGACSPTPCSSSVCGARSTATRPITCGLTSVVYAASWRPSRTSPATSSLSPASAIGSPHPTNSPHSRRDGRSRPPVR